MMTMQHLRGFIAQSPKSDNLGKVSQSFIRAIPFEGPNNAITRIMLCAVSLVISGQGNLRSQVSAS